MSNIVDMINPEGIPKREKEHNEDLRKYPTEAYQMASLVMMFRQNNSSLKEKEAISEAEMLLKKCTDSLNTFKYGKYGKK